MLKRKASGVLSFYLIFPCASINRRLFAIESAINLKMNVNGNRNANESSCQIVLSLCRWDQMMTMIIRFDSILFFVFNSILEQNTIASLKYNNISEYRILISRHVTSPMFFVLFRFCNVWCECIQFKRVNFI